jgi:hypothetical protein
MQSAAIAVPGLIVWTTTFAQSLNFDNAGWNGFNMRQVIDNTLLSTSGTHTRMTLEASSAGGCSIDAMYIGHAALAGDAYDFDGGQVQVLVGASGSFSIGAGSTVVTDDIAFALDETKNLVIAAHFNATSALRSHALVNANNWFKSAANETSTANVTGYTQSTSVVRLVNQIDVRS